MSNPFAASAVSNAAMGRRIFIGGSLATLALAAVPPFVRAFTPQSTNTVSADHFVPDPAAVAALDRFGSGVSAAHSALAAHQESHRRLFLRTAELRWRVPSSLGDVTETERHSEELSVWCDKFLPLGHEGMDRLASNLAHLASFARGPGARLKSSDALSIQTNLPPSELGQLGDDEFAEALGFDWGSQDRSVAGPVALAALVTVPLSALALFYRPLWDRMADAAPESEASMSRRALLRLFASGAGAAVGLATMGGAGQSVEGLRRQGRQRIRQTILDGNRMNDLELFRHFLGGSPHELSRSLLTDLRAFGEELSQINTGTVGAALAAGLIDLRLKAEEMESKIRGDNPSAYGFTFHETDDAIDLLTMLSRHMELAYSTDRALRENSGGIVRFLDDERVAMLGPGMRAMYISDRIAKASSGERGGHLGRIAGDAGLFVGIPLGALLLSEVPGPHHEFCHKIVEAVGRFFSRKGNAPA